jgi:hypothetical protein
VLGCSIAVGQQHAGLDRDLLVTWGEHVTDEERAPDPASCRR